MRTASETKDFSVFENGNFGKEPVLCRRCSRELTDPISVGRKIGPECIKLEEIELELAASNELDVSDGIDKEDT